MKTDLYKQSTFVVSAAEMNASIAAGLTAQQFMHAIFGPREAKGLRARRETVKLPNPYLKAQR
jgi:hypothetical protein